MLGAIRISGLHRFDHQVQRRGRPCAGLAQRKSLQDVEDFNEMRAAGRGRRHRRDVIAAITPAHRGTLDRPIRLHIFDRDDPAVLADRRNDLLAQRPVVERAGAVAGDRLQRGGKVVLHECVAAPEWCAVGFQKDLRRSRPARDPRLRERQRVGELVIDRDALAREPDRGRDQLGKREFARTVFLVREREPRDRARNADAERRIARFLRIGLAFVVEENVARHRSRRRLAVIDRDRLAGLWMGHGKRKADRHRRIDRIAAGAQDLDADMSRELLLRHHHPVARHHRERARHVGDDRSGRGRRDLRLRRRQCQAGNQPRADDHSPECRCLAHQTV